MRKIELQQPYEENREEVIGKFLFIEENIEKKKEVLYQMWEKKGKKRKTPGTSTIKKDKGRRCKG